MKSIGEDAGWKLALPEARAAQLKDFRVAVMPPMPWVKAASEMQGKVEELASFLSQRGAKVAQAMPNVDFEQYFRDYLCLLTVQTSQGQTRAEREASAAATQGGGLLSAQAEGFIIDAAGYLALVRRRELARVAWRA